MKSLKAPAPAAAPGRSDRLGSKGSATKETPGWQDLGSSSVLPSQLSAPVLVSLGHLRGPSDWVLGPKEQPSGTCPLAVAAVGRSAFAQRFVAFRSFGLFPPALAPGCEQLQ